MTAIAIQNKSEILKRIAAGDKIADIGKSYDVTQQAISKQLLTDPEWIDARMSGTLARIEHWEKEIEAINEGTPQVVLGRAREMLAHARWRAEREFPSQWGGHKLNINIGERSAPTTSDVLLEKDAKALVALIAKVE